MTHPAAPLEEEIEEAAEKSRQSWPDEPYCRNDLPSVFIEGARFVLDRLASREEREHGPRRWFICRKNADGTLTLSSKAFESKSAADEHYLIGGSTPVEYASVSELESSRARDAREIAELKAEVERLREENAAILAKCPNEEWECTKTQRLLEREIERLKDDVAGLTIQRDGAVNRGIMVLEAKNKMLNNERAARQKAEAERDGLAKALKFYADPDLYRGRRSHPENYSTDLEWDNGATAFEALKALEDK